MTCIIGAVENGVVYMGGDAGAGADWCPRVCTQAKVFNVGDFLIGYTTSFRMGQLLEHQLSVSPKQVGMSDIEYMVKVFVEAVRECFKTFAFTTIENSQEAGGQFLVGYNGNLYEVYENFQVNQWDSDFWACGSGAEKALVAMHLLKELPAQKRIERALEVVSLFSRWVVPPFCVKWLDKRG